MEFPTIEQVFEQLKDAHFDVEWSDVEDDGEGRSVDVRLQVYRDGDWTIHTGDAQYDTDHRGFWGASSIGPDDTDDDLRLTAEYLLSEAQDHAAELAS